MFNFSALTELIQTAAYDVSTLGISVLGILVLVNVFKWLRRVF